MPISAAGTVPNGDSAEKRPPIVGSPWKTARKARSRASASSSLPGSVTAAKCSPRPPAQAQKYSRCERVSIVEPDFEETTTSVEPGSSCSPILRTAAGWVESNIWKLARWNARRITSGARLEPPIPSSRTFSISARALPAKVKSSAACARERAGAPSQPSQFSSPLEVQSDASLAQIRWTISLGLAAAITPPPVSRAWTRSRPGAL